MKYTQLCETYEQLQNTSKGLEKTQIIAEFLKHIEKHPEYIYLLQGRIFPDHDSRELGISHQLAIRCIANYAGIKDSEVLELYKEKGELGLVSEEVAKKQKKQQSLFSTPLTVEKVMKNLQELTTIEGKGTLDKKIGLIIELLHNATPKETKYIIRTVLGDLKVGVGTGILRDGIVENHYKPQDITEKKLYSTKIQEAYDKSTDFAEVYKHTKENTLEKIKLAPGRPVKVMLFPKAPTVKEAFNIIGKPAAFEYKYDGFRVMINKDKEGNIKIFTRRLEEVTKQFPEIKEYIEKNVQGKTFILDGEAIGYNAETKEYTPFQDISQRIRRKYGIEKMAKEMPIELALFDIIYHEGKDLLEEPFKKRRELLKKITTEKEKHIILAKQIITDKEEEVETFYEQALQEKQEGLMGKNLEAPYRPGARVGYAVKLKPEDKDLDLVITGAEWGTGKRAGWLTSFNLSCKDEDEIKEVGKVSTGLKELEEEGLSFKKMTELLEPLTTKTQGRQIEVQPKIIVTIKYQNIQKSPTYTSGYALRFPRITRLRPDRSIDDITTIEEIAKEAE